MPEEEEQLQWALRQSLKEAKRHGEGTAQVSCYRYHTVCSCKQSRKGLLQVLDEGDVGLLRAGL